MTAEPKNFHFDLPKDAGIKLEHEIDSTIKQNEHTMKNKVRQLLSKYDHGNDTCEHGKQQN